MGAVLETLLASQLATSLDATSKFARKQKESEAGIIVKRSKRSTIAKLDFSYVTRLDKSYEDAIEHDEVADHAILEYMRKERRQQRAQRRRRKRDQTFGLDSSSTLDKLKQLAQPQPKLPLQDLALKISPESYGPSISKCSAVARPKPQHLRAVYPPAIGATCPPLRRGIPRAKSLPLLTQTETATRTTTFTTKTAVAVARNTTRKAIARKKATVKAKGAKNSLRNSNFLLSTSSSDSDSSL
eukprot:gb/GEZN01013740.1/.p1 GENE.gb/GEZN01013740.1/~~gb/GEZN01013740.1/.p1  ORF type:complete len:242 (-),score=29.56 gb/GEZN01013740.1/:148-873(-)